MRRLMSSATSRSTRATTCSAPTTNSTRRSWRRSASRPGSVAFRRTEAQRRFQAGHRARLFLFSYNGAMCRSIKTLFNFDPPATDQEIYAASLQFVRKLSGFNAPSRANEAAFNQAIDEVFEVARRLIDSLETTAPAKNREEEAAKARARSAARYAP